MCVLYYIWEWMFQRENASARRMGWKSRGRMRAIPLKTHLHPEHFWDSSEEKGEAAIATVCVGDASHPPLPPSFHHSIMPFTFSSDRTQQIHRHPPTRDDDSHSSHTHTDMCTAFTVYPDSDPEVWASRRQRVVQIFQLPRTDTYPAAPVLTKD